jgi:hypothetical protein
VNIYYAGMEDAHNKPRASFLHPEGVKQQSPGSPQAHPGDRTPRAPRTRKGFHRVSRVVVPDGEPVWPDRGTPSGFDPDQGNRIGRVATDSRGALRDPGL